MQRKQRSLKPSKSMVYEQFLEKSILIQLGWYQLDKRDCGAGLAGVNLVAGLTFAALSLSGVVQKLKISEDDRPLRAFMTVDLIIMDVISTAS
ncbi:hypothetical protein M5689_006859 [Euphorbia peplus]|nr:hypothetical protein M5689_006859 [Euphorbia peplus]